MGWLLPYPLGGPPSGQVYRYEQWCVDIVPPWLRRTNGALLLSSIGRVMDALEDRAYAGLRLRFPYEDTDSLAILGRERRIVRGPDEAALTYAGRVQAWRTAHKRRGSVYALLAQWYAYAARQVDVVYVSGTRYVLDEADGTVTKDAITWTPDDAGLWARAWCFLYEDTDPGAPTDAEWASLLVIPRLWNAAHMLPLNVVILWPEVGLWDYPPGIWDEVGALWTDDVPYEMEAA